MTKGPAFHVTAFFYIIDFLTGWSHFSMSFDWLVAKVDYDCLSFGIWRVQKATLCLMTWLHSWINQRIHQSICVNVWKVKFPPEKTKLTYLLKRRPCLCNFRRNTLTRRIFLNGNKAICILIHNKSHLQITWNITHNVQRVCDFYHWISGAYLSFNGLNVSNWVPTI